MLCLIESGGPWSELWFCSRGPSQAFAQCVVLHGATARHRTAESRDLLGRNAAPAAQLDSRDPAAIGVMLQVNELAFTRDGKLFMQATSSGVEVQHPPAHSNTPSVWHGREHLGSATPAFSKVQFGALRWLLLQVYSTATYEKCSMLNGHTGTVHSICVSPDDK